MAKRERKPQPTDVAIRRRSDGLFLYTLVWPKLLQTSETPKFLSSESAARLAVRVDMGLDLGEVDLVTRGELAGEHA